MNLINHSIHSVTPAIATLALAFSLANGQAATWSIEKNENPDGPGSRLSVLDSGQLVAAWSFGEGQFKPYLHVFGTDETRLTNSGLDKNGKAAGKFGHHRGIYIGWNRIESELGRHDLWHMKGTQMTVDKFTNLTTTGDHATTVADITWRAGEFDELEKDLLVSEKRTIRFSKSDAATLQIDFTSSLLAARDLKLGGDLQHAGVHFRAENEVANRAKETSYLWSPDLPAERQGMTSSDWHWATLIFPIGERWFQCTEMTAPANEFSELSWRDYGRFGFFDKKALKKGETLEVKFRFYISEIQPLKSAEHQAKFNEMRRKANDQAYLQFVSDLDAKE